MSRNAAARVVPLAALLALVVVATARVAVRRRRSVEPSPALATPVSRVAREGSLAAPDAGVAARVTEHAARMIHGDERHTHRAHGRGPRLGQIAWTYEADGPIEAQITASPDEQTLYVATLEGSLIALARDGTLRWRLALGDRAYATPCVADDGTIYVGSDAHRFFAVDPSGRIKWKLETTADADTGALIAPEGTVVFASGTNVLAVRAGGELAWRFVAKGKVFTAPARTGDGVFVFGSQDHHVYGVGSRGALAWSTDLGADVDGAPAISDDGAIYVGTDGGELVRLDGKGDIVWRTNVGGFVRGTLSVARNGDVLAGTYGPAPRVVRVGPDGMVRGTFAVQGTGAREFGVHGGPVEDDDGALFFGAQDDAVYSVGSDGSLRWRYATHGDVDAPATIFADGTLVVGSDDGKVYAFKP